MSRNRLGVHAGVWGFDWSPAAAERTIAGAAAAGFDVLEVPAIDRADAALLDGPATRRLLERHGIGATVSLALSFDDDITSPDASVAGRGERRLTEAVRFASELGATFVGGVVYSAMGRYLEASTDAGRSRSLDVLRRVAALAAGDGITLGVEYVNRYESNLLNTAAQTIRFLEDLGAANAVLHLDTFHAHVEEIDLPAAVAIAGDRLGYVHASESHRGRLGTGATDWPALCRAFATAGFDGTITVETFSSAVLTAAASADIGLWRPMWHDPDTLAAQSRAFLHDQLAAASVALDLAA
ncbi:sugar phosphate isomerase/epimerase family protein [Agromyces binzhouensis]|uniref:Sugar phosphate isomerase/epimerase n=1 Tax=Agromyces binzhouensis TaxID=1817495 RepID=A0A4Q2JP71_9MICO|nr:sugar phosphate isomerase/epimerase family protein [Agromyces binzhouensis]RXZ48479.1 sugar phosphate isomerase/epimerase [Agromyces binzhouensis]